MSHAEISPRIAYEPASRSQWFMPDGAELGGGHNEPAVRPFQFDRMLRRLPANITASLTKEQLDAISDALIPDPPSHLIDYRISIPFFGRRFYVTLFAGRERRSLARLAREAQLHAKHVAIFYSVLVLILGCISFIGFVLLGYLTKSALDIDLMDGPSMLHQYFFQEQSSTPGMEGSTMSALGVHIPKRTG